MQHRLTAEQKDAIPKRYSSGESCVALGRAYGVSNTAIAGILKRRGTPLRNRSDAARKHALNEAAFDILTPDALYWLGFIFADGCVFKGKHGAACLSVRLAAADKAHVEKLADFMGATHKITVRKQSGGGFFGDFRCCGIAVSSAHIAQRLYALGWKAKLGSVPNAVLCGSVDFWRGVIDGDGSVTVKRGKVPCVSLVGSLAVCSAFSDFLTRAVGYTTAVFPHKTIFEVRVSCGATAVKLLKQLYLGCGVALARKQEKAEQCFEWKCCSPAQQGLKIRKFTQAVERVIAQSGLTVEAAAVRFGCSAGCVKAIRRRAAGGAQNILTRALGSVSSPRVSRTEKSVKRKVDAVHSALIL